MKHCLLFSQEISIGKMGLAANILLYFEPCSTLQVGTAGLYYYEVLILMLHGGPRVSTSTFNTNINNSCGCNVGSVFEPRARRSFFIIICG